MADTKTECKLPAKDSTKPCCKDKQAQENNLVKATDLPLHGNPYPPKDVIACEDPGLLESKVSSIRVLFMDPIRPYLDRAQNFVATGKAHSQASLQRLSEIESTSLDVGIISVASVCGFLVGKTIFRRLFLASLFSAGAMAVRYPKSAEEKTQLAWYIAKNKLPDFARQQYSKLSGSGTAATQAETHSTKPDN